MPGDENESDLAAASRQLSERLLDSGFTRERVQMHFKLTALLEQIWQKFGFRFGGNFAEGWGYNLYSMNGRPSFDSSVEYHFVLPDCVVHHKDCACGSASTLTYDYLANGTIRLSSDLIQLMEQLGLTEKEGLEVMNAGMASRNGLSLMSRCSTNPEVRFRECLQVCPHESRRLLERSRPPDGLSLRRMARQPIFLCAVPSRQSQQARRPPRAQLDFCLLERQAFEELDEVQGHAYMAVKYLLLEALPAELRPRERPLSERHCRHLLLHTLATQPPQAEIRGIRSVVQSALRLLTSLIESRPEKTVVMPNFFCPELLLRLEETSIGNKAKLLKPLQALAQSLPQRLIEYADSLKPASADFVFRPLLMTIAGSGGCAQPVRDVADYPGVGFRIFKALDTLLEPRHPTQEQRREFDEIVGSLRPMAAAAAACLRALLILKLDRGPGLAFHSLAEAGEVEVLESFEFGGDVEFSSLLRRDFAWVFRGRFSKCERAAASRLNLPQGTAFLRDYPLIRSVFFPSRLRSVLHSDLCQVDYSLRINFVALWRAMRSQLNQDWGYELPTTPLDRKAVHMEAQELLVQSTLKLHSLGSLESLYQSLLTAASPFHRQRDGREWRWAHAVRLRLLGLWVAQLTRCDLQWTAEDRASYRALVGFCSRNVEHFNAKVDQSGVWLSGSEQQLRTWLRCLFDSELEATFGFDGESDPLVLQLFEHFHSDRRLREQSAKLVRMITQH